MHANDEHLYLQAMQEAEGNSLQEGLWAKALTLEKGNAEQAKYRYVQLRVEQLQKVPEVTEEPVPEPLPLELATPQDPDEEMVYGEESKQLAENESLKVVIPTYSFVTPTSNLTKHTILALWALVAMSFVAIISDVMQLDLIGNIRTITTEAAESNDTRVLVVNLTYVGIMLISSMLVLVWKYRANQNCRGFGAQDMQFTPGWAVGWQFVPFMNLFRPYQVMQEIWKVSSDPLAWQSQTGGLLVKWWWASCVVSMLIGQAYSRAAIRNWSHTESIRELEQVTSFSIITSCTILASTLMTIWVISAIREKQAKLAGESHLRGYLVEEKEAEAIRAGEFLDESEQQRQANIVDCDDPRFQSASVPFTCPNCYTGLQYTYGELNDIKKSADNDQLKWSQICPQCNCLIDLGAMVKSPSLPLTPMYVQT